MVRFDIVSLFTTVPIKETTDLLRCHFKENILGLFHPVLTTFYFTFNGQLYRQTDGVAMGSLLCPVQANFYMEGYKKVALEFAPLKPIWWFCYVDTFIIWPHGPDKLKDFLHQLNSIHQSTQFTMETKSEGHLLFLDLDVYRGPDGFLGHIVYCKPTPISTSMLSHIITHPINKWYCILWCISQSSL
jgi:hypothetical protein